MINKDKTQKKDTGIRSGFHWNWGKGITLVIILFIVATLSVVGYIVSLDYDMVTQNHYEKAVNYQEHINRVERADNMSSPVEIKLIPETKMVQLRFPEFFNDKKLTGTVKLYRPDDSSLDQKTKLLLDENGVQNIPGSDLAKGKWLIKLNWSFDGKKYFTQESIFL